LDELFEILTWAQLGIHQKPVALLDGTGFYSGLLDWMQTLVNNGFVKLKCKEMLRLYQNPIDLLDGFGLQIDQIRTAVQARMPDIR
jgi:predicted Rossmann-fold nucleotide-binding protein